MHADIPDMPNINKSKRQQDKNINCILLSLKLMFLNLSENIGISETNKAENTNTPKIRNKGIY